MKYKELVIYTLLGLVCCYTFTAFVRISFFDAGPYAALLTYPMYALVSWPLIQRTLLALMATIRYAALKDVQGRFYSYQGFPIRVIEDTDHCRWVPTAAIRKITNTAVADEALARRYPSGWQLFGNKGHLREDALMAHLSTATALRTIKFKNWAQKNIVYPAEMTRHRMGVKFDFSSEKG